MWKMMISDVHGVGVVMRAVDNESCAGGRIAAARPKEMVE
jgi:sugar (pentulose or hexulose) kinase